MPARCPARFAGGRISSAAATAGRRTSTARISIRLNKRGSPARTCPLPYNEELTGSGPITGPTPTPHCMPRLTALAIAFAVLAAPAAFAQATGRISGTVTAAETHAPIGNARVSVTTPQRVTLTDVRGSFTLR